MKVLFVTNTLAVGGIETNLVLLVREFTGLGHQVLVAARRGVLSQAVADAGARLVDLRSEVASLSAIRADARTLRDVLERERPDIVHLFSATAGIVHALATAGRRKGPLTVASVMGLQESPGEPWPVTQTRLLFTTLRAHRILVISPAIGARLRRLPIRRRRLVDLPVVGVDVPAPHGPLARERLAARARLAIPPDVPFVVTIGALAPRKSHGLFVEAAAQVVSKLPDARFAIVGDGPERRALEEQVAALGLGSRLRILGHVERLDDVFAAADVVVKPGVVEGFIGITVLEAQVRHIPVIAFYTQDVKAAIKEGETGLLVPAGDVAALGDAMVRILSNPALAKRLAAAGAAHAEQHFSIANVAKGLESFYIDLVRSQLQ